VKPRVVAQNASRGAAETIINDFEPMIDLCFPRP
jgi:hypothetical protein